MFIRIDTIKTQHVRKSKLGIEHTYSRDSSIVVLRCDNCTTIFNRPKGNMDPKRLNNRYFHVCSNCDSKRFAQYKGIEKKQVWDLPASSLKPVGRL
jgi:hypothetical protein